MPPKQQQMESFTHEEFINAMRMEGRTVRVTPESLEAARAQEARRLPTTTNSNSNVGRNWEALQEEEAERREREAREERKRKLQNVKTLEKRQEEEVTAETPPLPPPTTNKKTTTSATVESPPPPPLPVHEEASSSPSTSVALEHHNKEESPAASAAAAPPPPAAENPSPSSSIPTEEEGNGKEVEECTKNDDRTLPTTTELSPPPSSSSSSSSPPTAATAVVVEPKVQTFEEARRSITRRALAPAPPPPSAPPSDATVAEAVAASDASSTTTSAAAPPPVPENPSVTRVDGRHVRTLAVELWWVGSVDLDLSCLMFNKQMERCGIFFFGEQSGVAGDALFHTGDMLNAPAPNGAKETMIVHLDRLPPDVWYLYFVMTAFSADNCELVEEMLVRVADRTTATADSSGASSDRTLIGLDAKTMRTKRAAALALVARMDPPSRGGPSTFAVHCLESVCFSYGDTVRALSRDLHQHLTSTITAAK